MNAYINILHRMNNLNMNMKKLTKEITLIMKNILKI